MKTWIDLDAHMPDPNDPQPPAAMTFINDNILKIPPEYMTKTFLFDLAATWVIYVMAFGRFFI